jgi:hypothetical protein
MIITSVLVIFSVKSSQGYDSIFDRVKGQLSVGCQNNARDSSIKCELDACHKFGCHDCECNNPTTENQCKTYWDGVCCYVGVFDKFCSNNDKTVLDGFVKNLESQECKEYPRDSYQCNGSISIFGNFILILCLILFLSRLI